MRGTHICAIRANSSQILQIFSGQKNNSPKRVNYFSAEMRGFEPPKGFIPYLISSEAHSTGLCDISLET